MCPGDYFGASHDDLKLDVTWGDGSGVESIVHTATDNTVAYALRHTFATPGDHEVYMAGGWSDEPGHSVLNNSRLLAYATEADRPADTTPGKLKHWYQHNVSGGKYRDKLQGWQKDDDGNPLQGERGVEIVSVSKFYLAGEGTFKDFTLMDNFPSGVEPLYSADPTTNIQFDPTGTIRMDETFMNCGSLIGGNIWSFKSWSSRGLNKITSAARCFKNALAPVSTDSQRQFTVGQVTEQTSYINSDGETVIETTIINPGVKQWLPASGTSATSEVFRIHNWGMANCTDFTEMFENCGAKVINISRWDTSSGVHFDRMFKDCSFERLKLGLNGKPNSNINMISAETMNGMFDNCQFEQLKYLVSPDHRNYNKNYPREQHQKDFPLLDTGNVTDFDNCFRDSNFNTDISGWDVRKATTFENFRAGGALIDDHTPRFVYPVADIEVVDLTGNQDAQQMTVSLVNTTRWEWKMNDGSFVQQTDETMVDLSGVEEGLNTLTLHAYNVAGQLSDIEVSFIWVLGFGDHCAVGDGTAVLLWDDSDTWDDTKTWQETGTISSSDMSRTLNDTIETEAIILGSQNGQSVYDMVNVADNRQHYWSVAQGSPQVAQGTFGADLRVSVKPTGINDSYWNNVVMLMFQQDVTLDSNLTSMILDFKMDYSPSMNVAAGYFIRQNDTIFRSQTGTRNARGTDLVTGVQIDSSTWPGDKPYGGATYLDLSSGATLTMGIWFSQAINGPTNTTVVVHDVDFQLTAN